MSASTRLLTSLLRLLPGAVLSRLDAWSYRVAQRRAQARREAGLRLAQQRSGA